ncbi:MAG TPA: transporter associated domain-containing protein [Gammaproteobacteria bacterium]|nr:transporter associated domain-containing protein [Gammaproteobacteria bacterium]
MNDERPSTNGPGGRSWLERLSQALSGEPRDRDDLMEVLRDAQQRGLIDVDAEAMIEGVLQVTEMQVRDIMIPRAQMTVVERDASLDAILPIIIESGYSRFPVIGESRDEVVGILLAKDLLRYANESGRRSFNIREVLRPVSYIPESKRLNVLLKDFRSSRNHIAIVVDEYGGVAGLVTIEDVLEQIVGEIDDEHDFEEDTSILKYSDTRYLVKALTDIEDFNEYFGSRFSDDEFDTIGGLLMNAFGHLPKRGENIDFGGMRFQILRADSRRIHLIQVNPKPETRQKESVS